MLSIRPAQPAMKAGVRTRMKPARQRRSAPLSARGPASAASKAARSPAKGAVVDGGGRDAEFGGALEPGGARAVREDEAGPGRMRRVGHVAGEGEHVGAAAGDQDRDAAAAHAGSQAPV